MKSAKELYRRVIDHYGTENQLFQLDEELAELIKAVNKWRRNRGLAEKYPAYVGDVAEEIADVEIMLDQLKIILNIYDTEIYDYKCRKLQRLRERLDEDRE